MSSNIAASVTTSVAVTPSDTVNFTTGRAVGLYIGGAGNVVLIDDSGTEQTFTGLLVGHVYDFACTRVNATNTTATNIRALYRN
jgi:hypothetical protein